MSHQVHGLMGQKWPHTQVLLICSEWSYCVGKVLAKVWMPKTANSWIIKPSYVVGLMCETGKRYRGGVPDRRTVSCVWAILDLIESEKSSGVTITFIPVAWPTIGFSLTDTEGQRRGARSEAKMERESSTPSCGKVFIPPYNLPSKPLRRSEMLNWISGDKCSDDWWLTGHYLDSLEGR